MLAAVRCGQNGRVADHPAVLGVDEIKRVNAGGDAAGLRDPGLAAVGRGQNRAPFADNPAVVLTHELDLVERFVAAASHGSPNGTTVDRMEDVAGAANNKAIIRCKKINAQQVISTAGDRVDTPVLSTVVAKVN